MKKFRKFTMGFMSLTLGAVMSLFAVGGSAFATVINYEWSVGWFGDEQENLMGWEGNGSTKFSVDDKVHTDSSWYSIKLENTDYNISYVERTYDVEPNTTYKFSAMVKYSGYALSPDAEVQKSGACVGKAYSYENSGYTASSDWTLMEYEFTTGDEKTCNLALQNGIYDGTCKGTAWFSDVKLEKAEMTNNWNMLAVFFKNVDINVTMNGKPLHLQKSMSTALINEINTYVLDKLPSSLNSLSNNKMTVNSIDRFYVDKVLTEKEICPYTFQYDDGTKFYGYRINAENSELVSKTLDEHLAKKEYNYIAIFAPISKISADENSTAWWGITSAYKGIALAQVNEAWGEGAFKQSEIYGSPIIHEFCHGLEHRSIPLNGDKTPSLDNDVKYYREKYGMSEWEWYNGYMTSTLPDGRGLDPSVFYVTSGKYIYVSDDMTTGKGIEPGSSSVTPPAPKNFTVKSETDEKVRISWNAVTNAAGYQLALFNSADFKEIWKTFDYKSDRTSTALAPITKGKPYYYGVRTATSINGSTVYSDWTTLTYTHNGVGGEIVHGDVDNDGIFTILDVSAALRIYINNTSVDQRTLIAAGAADKGRIGLNDVSRLLKEYVNS